MLLPGRQLRTEAGVQIVAPCDGEPERLQQLCGLGLLEHIAARPGAQRLARILGILAHRQDRYRQRRMCHEARRQRRQTRAPGHRQIERQKVGPKLTHRSDRRGDVSRFADEIPLKASSIMIGDPDEGDAP